MNPVKRLGIREYEAKHLPIGRHPAAFLGNDLLDGQVAVLAALQLFHSAPVLAPEVCLVLRRKCSGQTAPVPASTRPPLVTALAHRGLPCLLESFPFDETPSRFRPRSRPRPKAQARLDPTARCPGLPQI